MQLVYEQYRQSCVLRFYRASLEIAHGIVAGIIVMANGIEV
jgi:hypothetical protein